MRKYFYFFLTFSFIFTTSYSSVFAQDSETVLLEKSLEIVQSLEKSNYESVSKHVHSERGLQFSPYDRDKLTKKKSEKFPNNVPNITKFEKDQLLSFYDSETVYTWGNFDGSGFHIKLTPHEYHKRFVYDIDYLRKANPIYIPNIKTKKWKKKWRTVKHLFKAYPNSEIIQFKYKGTPEAAYNDFKNLNLVFEKIDRDWSLIAIVHGEKTS